MNDWKGLVPRALQEALSSLVISEAFPHLTWSTGSDLAVTIAVTIPVTPQHKRTRVIGVAEDLARLSPEQLRQLIGFYFPEPTDPRSLLALVSDRAGQLWRLWQEHYNTHSLLANKTAERTWSELQAALKSLHSALDELVPENEHHG